MEDTDVRQDFFESGAKWLRADFHLHTLVAFNRKQWLPNGTQNENYNDTDEELFKVIIKRHGIHTTLKS